MNVRKPVAAAVAVVCVSMVGLSGSAPALAASPPVIDETEVLDVAGTSATFTAQINPQGSETTYRFEYGTSEAYGSSVPIPDGLVGSGATPVRVSAHAQQGLLPNTTYPYRVVALVASRSEVVPGVDGVFTTQPAGGELVLPDNRQWELVSPPNKHGGVIWSLAEKASGEGPTQAAENGSAFTYGTNVPSEAEPAGYGQQNFREQLRSARGPGGWSTRDIATPHDRANGINVVLPEYLFFSADLSLGLVTPVGADRRLLSAQASEPTPYIRREALCDAPASAAECYLPVLTAKEGFADVPPGVEFGRNEGAGLGGREGVLLGANFEGASPDLRHVVLSSIVDLKGPPAVGGELYEWSAGVPPAVAVRPVSLLPASEGGGPADGKLAPLSKKFTDGARHAVSDDGSRIVWDSGARLYMRDTAVGEAGETVRLDVQQPGAPVGGSPRAMFQVASADGSRVFFTDSQRLTGQSGSAPNPPQEDGDLYECRMAVEAGQLKCELTDLTPESGGRSAEVQSVVSGASEDGSYVYFVANGVLGDGAAHGATQGECQAIYNPNATCNLYVIHDGGVTFIATLSVKDELDWAGENLGYNHLGRLTARSSPDGRFFAFMSTRSLTGYDNRDAVSGSPDSEVYLYDAVTGRLVCASCNPTGSRPLGVNGEEFYTTGPRNENAVAALFPENGGWLAANLPPGAELSNSLVALYQPRYLTDRGRLFFNSSDVLVPQDVNGTEDVYEFEPEGVGSCRSSNLTYSARSGGCVSLISAGTSSEESGFLDASGIGPGGEEGEDVFFLTSSRLSSLDVDTAYDVYDAHACSVVVACVPPPATPPACATEASCRAAPSPQPAVFGAPASATFVGAGNVVASPSGAGVAGRSLSRAQRLAGALRACRQKPRRRRGVCERRARGRYAAAGRIRAGRARG
jgi:hypothetical protein